MWKSRQAARVGWAFSWRREGDGLVETGAPGEAMVEAADHAVEEVAPGRGVPVAGFAAAVVVGPCSD